MSMQIDDFQVEGTGDQRTAVWRADRDELEHYATWTDHAGQVLITLGVDGDYDTVHANVRGTGTLHLLRETIGALTRLHDTISDLDLAVGRCTIYGDTGRCKEDHGAPCIFPTEEEMRRDIEHECRMRQVRAARASAVQPAIRWGSSRVVSEATA
ncbi:hypothetical protein ACOACQ_17615 [Nocardioides sp. CPCC 206347]|uniref:hypothetical protein n=1 Tax=unclassified Nocardioides TaxID=2615069 RepID=UPI003623A5D7